MVRRTRRAGARGVFPPRAQLGLDEIVASDTHEALSERLWRRYAANANAMLDAIEKDASLAEPLLEQAGIRRCEIAYLAQHEMIVKLEDYLRRRSKIELLLPRETCAIEGLKQACKICSVTRHSSASMSISTSALPPVQGHRKSSREAGSPRRRVPQC